MDYRKIARTILGMDEDESILLTESQINHLAETIDQLPDEQQQWLIDYSTFDTDIDELGKKIFQILHSDLRLRAILCLGNMQTVDLVDILTGILSGNYAVTIESNSTTSHSIVLKRIEAEDIAQDAYVTEANNHCKLQALFGATISDENRVTGNITYLETVRIFNEQLGPQQPVVFDDRCYTALRRGGIQTNADLIRWYREDPHTRRHIFGVGEKRLEQIKEYLDYWFSPEKQKLLHDTAPR